MGKGATSSHQCVPLGCGGWRVLCRDSHYPALARGRFNLSVKALSRASLFPPLRAALFNDARSWENSSCFKTGCILACPPGAGSGDAVSNRKTLMAELSWAQPVPVLLPRTMIAPHAPEKHPGARQGDKDVWVREQSQAMAACFPVASRILRVVLIAPCGFDSWI